MPRPILYAAITNHGFGHATRMAAVLATLQRLCPDLLLILVTTAPRFLLESYLTGDFILRPRALDVGVIQSDGVTMDLGATLGAVQEVYAQRHRILAGEVQFIQQNRVQLIFADIPPLAAALGQAAGIPVWMMGNFGWDYIYRSWVGNYPDFAPLADWMGDCFSQSDRLFRLPFHEPMAAFPQVTDVGLTGGDPRFGVAELREFLGLRAPQAQIVLLTFGGLGLQAIPYDRLAAFPHWQFLTLDSQAPDLPNLIRVRGLTYQGYPLRPVDLMPLCRCVVSKPGYGTFSEACRLGVPLISLDRQGFAETPVLLAGLRRSLPHRILRDVEFFETPWTFLQEPLTQPSESVKISHDGNDTIARSIAEFFAASP
ncbi:MAG: glycosyl transferase [Prochlorothrix sp.]|nr:glycosyl transferase [Prochlorothrix sp.]